MASLRIAFATWMTCLSLTIDPRAHATTAVSPKPPALTASAAILENLDTGQVLYAKNPLERLYPASITKIMTALLALKYGKPTDRIRTSAYAASQEPNKLYLVPGEVHDLRSMLFGMLIDSGNDAAVAIGEHYGGTVKGFAAMMNAEAASLGARNTHFVNPNGLHNPNHYTCVYDMALIARAAMHYPLFRQIVDTKYYMWRGNEWKSYLSNLNQMLWWYPGADGVKTGYTDQAEQTIVVTAKRGRMHLLAVLMHVNGLQTVQNETGALLDYGFAAFRPGTLVPAGTQAGNLDVGRTRIPLLTRSPIEGLVPLAGAGRVKFESLSPGARNFDSGVLLPPIPSASPATQRLVTLRLRPGTRAGSTVGYADVGLDGTTFRVPVKLGETIPLAPALWKPGTRPPLWPALTAAAICLISLIAGRRRRPKVRHFSGSFARMLE